MKARANTICTVLGGLLLLARGAAAQCPNSIAAMSPANGATNVPSVGQFTWSVANGTSADYFNVFFGPAGQGCSLTTPTLVTSYGGSSFVINYQDLAPNTTYEWRVEAVKNGCATITSSCATFTSSACSAAKANLIYPIGGAAADHLTVKFSWDPVFGATGYNVVVDGTLVGSTTTATDLVADIPPGNHQWYVESLFGTSCTPSRSDIGTFSTACPSGTPSPVSPAGGQSLSSPRDIMFQWTAVSGADGYNVFVQQGTGAPQQIGQTREGVSLAATNITATLPGPGSYTWFVDALSSGCPSIRSTSGNFTVVDICPKTPATLIAPADGSTVDPNVTFTWNAIPNADVAGLTGYKVFVSINGAAPAVVQTTTGTSATASLPPGSHAWFVEADFSQCLPLISARNKFTINAPPVCPASGPALITPPQGATNVSSPVAFSWNSVANATTYLLFAGLNGQPPAQVATSNTTSASVLMPAGPIEWFVQAVVQGCANVSSAQGNFTAANPTSCPSTAPSLVEPPNGVTITRQPGDPPPSFVWSAVPGARNYTLSVIVNGQTINIPADQTIVSGGGNLNLPAGPIEWFVSANFDGCLSVASTHARFTLADAPPCVLSAPVPTSPASGNHFTNTVVQFTWTAVDGATEYRVFAKSDPNSPDLILIGKTSGETSLQATLPFGPNRWAVEAAGGTRCTPARSASVPFTIDRAPVCNSTPPPLVSPNPGATVPNPVQFIWNGVSGATGYRLWITPVGGSATPIGDVADPSVLTATANVPEGDSEWYIEATFPGCDSAFSEHRRITVASCSARPPTLTLPFESANNVTSPATLAWTPVTGATSYDIFIGQNGQTPAPIASVPVTNQSQTTLTASLDPGPVTWYIRAFVPDCTPRISAPGHFFVIPNPACATPERPSIAAQAEVTSNQPYLVQWIAVANTVSYELQEAKAPDFSGATTLTVSVPQNVFSHDAPVDTLYYYRVRAKSSCNDSLGPYSEIAIVRVKPSTSTSTGTTATTSIGSQQVILQQVFVPGTPGITRAFTAHTDKPWITVNPSSGNIPPEGITLTLTADPSNLSPGSNSATVIIEYPSAAGTVRTEGTTPATSVPVSVNLVAPVLPTGKEAPPPDALIIPAVASAQGAFGSHFLSDVRLTNTSAQSTRYNVLFTPSNSDATRNTRQASVDVPAGQTIALDDVLKSWFGAGTSALTGVLDIRPLSTGATNILSKGRTSLGSSRTYNSTPNGTYGQFIPAIPFAQFAGQGQTLTMNELAESPQFRTNLGLVEASGQAATAHITAYGPSGNVLTAFDVFLQPGEQKQLNQVLRANNVTSDNARIDVKVTSATGKVMAYASVLDNRTNDPMLVTPKQLSSVSDTNIVVPGVADINTGSARWKSDVTMTNGGTLPVTATLTFYPSGDPAHPKSITTALAPNESKQLTDVLNSSFGVTQSGGALHVTTSAPSALMVSARTYNDVGNGTYGQFIPGVSEKEGLGINDGALQVQQVEESAAFRSNLGIVEMSGKPVQVEVTAVQPDSKIAPRAVIPLQANEFQQLNGVTRQLGLTTLYNGRVSIRVVGGSGKIAVYGSIVDNKSGDPTFVPGEQ